MIEVREMGVGHFKFSTDESQRQEQFQQLNNLREQVSLSIEYNLGVIYFY